MNLDNYQLPETLQKVLMPALIGAAGTGALTGYVSSRSNVRNELPSDRRKRILRNALLGSVLGGTAAAAIPTGMGMLRKEMGSGGGFNATNWAAEKTLSHGGAIGAGIAGKGMWDRARGGQQTRALNHILSYVKNKNVGPISVSSIDDIERIMQDKGLTNELLKSLSSRMPEHISPELAKHPDWVKAVYGDSAGSSTVKNMLSKLQLLQEGGLHDYKFSDLPGLKPGMLEPALAEHLREQSVLPKQLRMLSPAHWLAKGVGKPAFQGVGPTGNEAAEWFLRNVRPAVRNLPRIRGGSIPGNMGRGAALIGSMIAAQKAQDLLTGK